MMISGMSQAGIPEVIVESINATHPGIIYCAHFFLCFFFFPWMVFFYWLYTDPLKKWRKIIILLIIFKKDFLVVTDFWCFGLLLS
jgi:hypothetical protein